MSTNGVPSDTSERTFAQIATRLSKLIDDLQTVRIDRDLQRELLTLYASGKDGTSHPARSLSDGTLRFLALAVLEMDPEAQGVICLEEPENGIHPSRIPALLQLLQDIACDTDEAVDEDNPLRQVIVNTHSPSVVAEFRTTASCSRNWWNVLRMGSALIRCSSWGWRTRGVRAIRMGLDPSLQREICSHISPHLPLRRRS